MLPPPPWLPDDEFRRWMTLLQCSLVAIIVLLAVGFGVWVFAILPAMLR
jgi:hypothetical protein